VSVSGRGDGGRRQALNAERALEIGGLPLGQSVALGAQLTLFVAPPQRVPQTADQA